MSEGDFRICCLNALNKDISIAQFKRDIREASDGGVRAELIAAAKEFVKGGRHEGECSNRDNDEEAPCVIHLSHYRARREKLCELIGAA